MRRRLLLAEANQRDLAAILARKAPAGKRMLGKAPAPFRVADLRKNLAADEVFIDVFCLRPEENKPRAYYAWVTTRAAAPRVVTLGDADKIERLVQAFADHMTRCAGVTGLLKKLGPVKAEQTLRKESLLPLSRLLLNKDLWALAGASKRWIVSSKFHAFPFSSTSISLTVKSVSFASEET